MGNGVSPQRADEHRGSAYEADAPTREDSVAPSVARSSRSAVPAEVLVRVPARRGVNSLGVGLDGLTVVSLSVRGVAKRGGVRIGMVLTQVGDFEVGSPGDLEAAMRVMLAKPPPDGVAVVFEDSELAEEMRQERMLSAAVQRTAHEEDVARAGIEAAERTVRQAQEASRSRLSKAPPSAAKAIFIGDEDSCRRRVEELERKRRAKMQLPYKLSYAGAQLVDQARTSRRRINKSEAAARARLHDIDDALTRAAVQWNAAKPIQSAWRGYIGRKRLQRSRAACVPTVVLAATLAAATGYMWWRFRRRLSIRAAYAAAACVPSVCVAELRADLLCLSRGVDSAWEGHWQPALVYRHLLPLETAAVVAWKVPERAVAKWVGGPREQSRSADLPLPLKWSREWHPIEQRDVFYPVGIRTPAAAVWTLPGGKQQESRAMVMRSCRNFRKGRCADGDQCRDTHGMAPTPLWQVSMGQKLGCPIKDLDRAAGQPGCVWGWVAAGNLPDWLASEAPERLRAGTRPDVSQGRLSTMRAQGRRKSNSSFRSGSVSPRKSTSGLSVPSLPETDTGEKVDVAGLLKRVNGGLSPEHMLFQMQTTRGMREGGTSGKGLIGWLSATANNESAVSALPPDPKGGLPCAAAGKLKIKEKKKREPLPPAAVKRGEQVWDPEGKLAELGGCFCSTCLPGFTQYVDARLPHSRRQAWNIGIGFNYKDCVLRGQGSEAMREELSQLWYDWVGDPLCPHGDPRRRVRRRRDALELQLIRDPPAAPLGVIFQDDSLVVAGVVPDGLFEKASGGTDMIGWRVGALNGEPLGEGLCADDLLLPAAGAFTMLMQPPVQPVDPDEEEEEAKLPAFGKVYGFT
eukprot:TRINITY_DN28334_c0_g1_i1.p1 TRINITY_DN28334_c0_g1~~TRINITY_DN28334_c0_g1_i1.p1  ORF type:complete len:856 (+),score=214.95 TRINITY_DN28334_c0_g1_i1:91-2658(+)